jgi:hypothetical protein
MHFTGSRDYGRAPGFGVRQPSAGLAAGSWLAQACAQHPDFSGFLKLFGVFNSPSAWAAGLGLLFSAAPLRAEVVTYPPLPQEVLSEDYQVWVNGKPVEVCRARVLDEPFSKWGRDYGGPYSFANFDMSGPVTVRIAAKRSLALTVLRPHPAGVEMEHADEKVITLTLNQPQKLSVEPDGKNGPLLLFANPLETDRPKDGAPGVIYFGPGLHKGGAIHLKDGQTLYLAGGALVKGAIVAEGSNVRICGRGILDGSDYPWQQGPHDVTIGIYGTNVTLSGITIRGSSHWTIALHGSRQVTIRDVKLCNSRVQNDDGIDPCNSQDVLIRDCFIRSDDDCIAFKGMDFKAANSNVERIRVEHCVLWCDRARVFLLGHESRAAFMRDLTLRDLDIIHFVMPAFLLEPGEEMRLENVLVENVRVHGEGQQDLVRLKPSVNEYMWKKVPGSIRNVRFKNLSVNGKPGAYLVNLEGADAEHEVRNVTFQGVSVLGRPLTREQVKTGAHTADISFSP